jgi:hypothetical protein
MRKIAERVRENTGKEMVSEWKRWLALSSQY